MRKYFFIVVLISWTLNSCAVFLQPKIDVRNDTNGYLKTTQKFLDCLYSNSFHKAKRLSFKEAHRYLKGSNVPKNERTTWGMETSAGLKFYVNDYYERLQKFGMPSKEKWRIEYDTLGAIVQFTSVIIPIYDSSNFECATIKLSFDYSGHYVPSSKIVWFYHEVHLK